jgi:hypothetical protein
MKPETNQLVNIISKLCPYLQLVQAVEKDNYVELLYKGDSPNFLANSEQCQVYKLLGSLSVCKRYIKKEGKIPWLWSISTFKRSSINTMELTIAQIERELIGTVQDDTTPPVKLSKIENRPVLATIDMTELRENIRPKEDPLTGKFGRGIYNPYTNTNQQEIREVKQTGFALGERF